MCEQTGSDPFEELYAEVQEMAVHIFVAVNCWSVPFVVSLLATGLVRRPVASLPIGASPRL